MPAIIVISDPNGKGESTVTLEERVVRVHLEDGHSAAQLVERIGWAILDAEEVEIAARAAAPSDPSRRRARFDGLRLSERALAA